MFDIERYKFHLSYEDLLKYYLRAQTSGANGRLAQEYWPEDYKQMSEDLEYLNSKKELKNDI